MKRRLLTLLAFCSILCVTNIPGASAETPECQIKHDPFVARGISSGTMVTVQGAACQFKFRFRNVDVPDSWELIDPPKSGKVVFKGDVVEYQPNEGFLGGDKFIVGVFGRLSNCSFKCYRNGRFQFSVSVKVKPESSQSPTPNLTVNRTRRHML